jgi:hypothetical protein
MPAGLVGQELDAQDPPGTGDVQPVQILSPGSRDTLLEILPFLSPPQRSSLAAPCVHTPKSSTSRPVRKYILPISVGVPLLGDWPVNPSAAFQKRHGEEEASEPHRPEHFPLWTDVGPPHKTAHPNPSTAFSSLTRSPNSPRKQEQEEAGPVGTWWGAPTSPGPLYLDPQRPRPYLWVIFLRRAVLRAYAPK